jgi:hypothetical protein
MTPGPGNEPPFNSGMIQPGPPFIDPGQCPGGIVMRVYDTTDPPTLITEQFIGPDDDVEMLATMAAAMHDRAGQVGACLVAYDGDTGHRAGPLEWGTSVG